MRPLLVVLALAWTMPLGRAADLTVEEALAAVVADPLAVPGELRIRLSPDTPPEALEPLTQGSHLTLLGVDDPLPELLEVVAKAAGGLALPDVRTLRPAAARVLAAGAAFVALDGLEHLPVDVATALGGGNPDLHVQLNGLEEIAPEAAVALRRQPGVVPYLGGLRRLSPAAAKPLVGIPCELRLAGLESLEAATAAVLAAHENQLLLPGLRRLDPATIRGLAGHRSHLELGSREPLSVAAAEALGSRRAPTLLRIPVIDLPTARALATNVKGSTVEVVCPAPLPNDVVDVLAGNRRITFQVDQLTALSVVAAEALAGRKNCPLCLDRLTDVSPALAAALARNNDDPLSLGGLKTLSPEVARALAGHRGGLALPGLETIDCEVATIVAAHGNHLMLGLKALSPEVARGLARHTGGLQLDAVESLAADTVAALGGGPESLSFASVRTLDAATARVLGEYAGSLSLGGLTALPPEVAEPLLAGRSAAAGGPSGVQVDVGLLTGLTPRLAQALVRRGEQNGEEFDLAAVERLDSADTARALAATKQRIALPNLRQVIPAALAALQANPLVEIPAPEALQFLPNTDGSTDDFAVP